LAMSAPHKAVDGCFATRTDYHLSIPQNSKLSRR
jgi:hypothetical protein